MDHLVEQKLAGVDFQTGEKQKHGSAGRDKNALHSSILDEAAIVCSSTSGNSTTSGNHKSSSTLDQDMDIRKNTDAKGLPPPPKRSHKYADDNKPELQRSQTFGQRIMGNMKESRLLRTFTSKSIVSVPDVLLACHTSSVVSMDHLVEQKLAGVDFQTGEKQKHGSAGRDKNALHSSILDEAAIVCSSTSGNSTTSGNHKSSSTLDQDMDIRKNTDAKGLPPPPKRSHKYADDNKPELQRSQTFGQRIMGNMKESRLLRTFTSKSIVSVPDVPSSPSKMGIKVHA
ncbi:hypothetical protein POM88_009439 [Heracleum sosnowskyi]|uniref:Uncharacterized protein n=1 Tax=Heracleum sosnowskyi TaxID=360622 RepID=A0AAD8J9E5_9APIA|nr:hypothetical protein POM88_009439 [Heracleum sosnowskyi]